MKKVKIFLASSIDDLRDDRLEVGDYFRQLNEIYFESGIHFSLVKCEDYDNSVALSGKQSEFDNEIRDSALCFFLFFKKVGNYTKHEFEVALESYKEKNKPRIVTYFKYVNSIEEAQGEVRAFMSMLDAELHHYYNVYGHVDTLKLGILMQIKLLGLDSSEIELSDGDVKLNGEVVLQAKNVPMLGGNKTLSALTEKKRELSNRLSVLRRSYLENPNDIEIENALFDVRAELKEVSEQLSEVEREALIFASTIAEMTTSGKVLTVRQKEALKYFNTGNYEAAQEILDDEERENELKRAEARAEISKQELQGYVEEDLLWIKATRALGVTKESAEAICQRYEKILALIDKHDLDKEPLFDYAEFLKKQNNYDKAIEVAELLKWYYDKPGSGASKQSLGDLLNLLSVLYSTKQKQGEAENASQNAVKLFSALLAIDPSSIRAQAGLAQAYISLARIHLANQRFNDAEELFIIAVNIYESLATTENAELEAELASAYGALSAFYSTIQKPDKAEDFALKNTDIRKKLAQKNPEQHEAELANAYIALGNVYFALTSYDTMEKYTSMACEILERLAQMNPDAYEPALAAAYANFAFLCYRVQRYDDSKEYFDKGISLYEYWAKKDPDTFLPIISIAYNNASQLYIALKYFDKAEKYLLDAIDICIELCKINKDTHEPTLGLLYNNLSQVYSFSLQPEKSKECVKKAIAIYEVLAEKNPEVYKSMLAVSYMNLAQIYTSLGKNPSEAKALVGKAVTIYEELASKYPEANEPALALAYNNMSQICTTTQDFDQGKEYAWKAIEINKRYLETNVDAFEPALGLAYMNYGVCCASLGEMDEGLEYIELSREIYERLVNENPEAHAQMLTMIYANLTALYMAIDDEENALESLFKSYVLYQSLTRHNPKVYLPIFIQYEDNVISAFLDAEDYERVVEIAKIAINLCVEVIDNHPELNDITKPLLASAYTQAAMISYYQLDEDEYALETAILGLDIYKEIAPASPKSYKEDVCELMEIIELEDSDYNLGVLADLYEDDDDDDDDEDAPNLSGFDLEALKKAFKGEADDDELSELFGGMFDNTEDDED